jgi:hypothetical protein
MKKLISLIKKNNNVKSLTNLEWLIIISFLCLLISLLIISNLN